MQLAIPGQLYHNLDDCITGAQHRDIRARFVNSHNGETLVPSLIRFLVICGVLAGLVYAGMFALATMVEPQEREIRVKVPSKKINP